MVEVPWRLWAALRCPACGAPPGSEPGPCPRCGRPTRTADGCLDLLPDELKAEADAFGERYVQLRQREGWADARGIEDPDLARGRIWRSRRRAAGRAAEIVRAQTARSQQRPLVADVGAGGGWLARLLPFADVVALDLVPPAVPSASIRARADMRRLPLVDASMDALVFSASLHYVPVRDALAEAARVLRPGGGLVAVESPIYSDELSLDQAQARTSAYFLTSGAPELAERYHPFTEAALRAALESCDLQISRLDPSHRRYGWLRMLHGSAAFPTLVARKPAS